MQNKKKPKDILTHKQFAINKLSDTQTVTSNNWLKANGFKVNSVFDTHLKLLQAQQQAHILLSQHIDLLTQAQATTLRHFQNLMMHKNTRNKLKPESAYPTLNISTKINRKLFQLTKKN